MGAKFPHTPDIDGDEPAVSPNGSQHRSLLGTIQGTDRTRRVSVDDLGRVLTVVDENNAGAGPDVSILATGSASSVVAGATVTVVTLTATAKTYITVIRAEASDRAKYHLRLNGTTLFDFQRSDRGKNVEWTWPNKGLVLSTNDILDVRAIHNTPGGIQADLTGVIYGGV